MKINIGEEKVFDYNLSFYYLSTIAYFVALLLYAFVKGEFVDGSLTIITKDPIIFFLGIIVVISLGAVLYYLFLNKKIIITDESLKFVDRLKTREILYDEIVYIKMAKEKGYKRGKAFRLIRIKTKKRKLPYSVRPFDYEKQSELVDLFRKIKYEVGSV